MTVVYINELVLQLSAFKKGCYVFLRIYTVPLVPHS